MGKRTITNSDDIIDTRDLAKQARDIEETWEEDGTPEDERDDDELALVAFAKLCEDEVSEYNGGAALIHEDHFTEYAKQLADDIGAVDINASWPICHIDWAAAAYSLRQDYSAVDFYGVTYYARS